MAKSIEEQIEDKAKQMLKEVGVKYFTKTETINSAIDNALAQAPTKSGGIGSNRPDIKVIIQGTHPRHFHIPVMIEVKGKKGDLIKENKLGLIDNSKNNEPNYTNIQRYAVNGAVHYANAILNYSDYEECIAIGINGYQSGTGNTEIEIKAYYLAKKFNNSPLFIADFSDLSFLSKDNLEQFINQKISTLSLSAEQIETQTRHYEDELDRALSELNQVMHDTLGLPDSIRVQLISGMIMAGLGVKDQVSPLEIEDLKGLTGKTENDGIKIINKIEEFLNNKDLPQDKQETIINELNKYFNNPNYYKPVNGESKIKTVYRAVKSNILPFFTQVRQIDLTGQLFNTLNKWVAVPDGAENDVVLTPRYVTRLMARLCQVNKDSFVWDYATGSGGFLISAMELMIADAKAKIKSPQELKQKEWQIKSEQLLGIEILPDIYILAVLNMILMGDGSSHILNQDSLEFNGKYSQGKKSADLFPANIFLLNPPYSAKGNGMIFVEKAFAKMKKGRGAVIIQNSAGSGRATEFNKRILANNTLLASIRMPNDIFKTSVNTCIYLFDIGTEHDSNKQVLFIDFSNDGYTRSYRKKTSATNNLKNTDHAIERYDEIVDIVLDRKRKTNYYQDGKEVIKDTITLLGNDWNFDQHQKTDTMPQLADFKKTVADYLSYEVNQILSGSLKTENPLGKY